MKLVGTVSGVSKTEIGGVTRLSFWLRTQDGKRVSVQCDRSLRIADGQTVEVVGPEDNEGTLTAERVTIQSSQRRVPWIIPAAVILIVAIAYWWFTRGATL